MFITKKNNPSGLTEIDPRVDHASGGRLHTGLSKRPSVYIILFKAAEFSFNFYEPLRKKGNVLFNDSRLFTVILRRIYGK